MTDQADPFDQSVPPPPPRTCRDYLDLGEEAAYWCELHADGHDKHSESGITEEWHGARLTGRVVRWRMAWTYTGDVVDADGV